MKILDKFICLINILLKKYQKIQNKIKILNKKQCNKKIIYKKKKIPKFLNKII